MMRKTATRQVAKKFGFFSRLLDDVSPADRYRLATEQIVLAERLGLSVIEGDPRADPALEQNWRRMSERKVAQTVPASTSILATVLMLTSLSREIARMLTPSQS